MTQFDPQFEVKMVTHFCIGANKSPDKRFQYQQALLQYATLFDPAIKDKKAANQAKQPNHLTMRRFVNENIVGYLIQTCQFKFINYFLVAMVNDLQPAYATDNDYFLSNFTLFATPESLKKVATCVRLGTVQIVDCSLRRTLKSIPSCYFSQTALWTLLQAQLSTKDSSLLRTFQQ